MKSSVPIYDHLSEREAARMLATSAPAFIVGTGRCGTKYYTHLIGDFAENVEAAHEPYPRLIRENYNPFISSVPGARRAILEAVLAEPVITANMRGNRYLLSSQIMTYYLDAIGELFQDPLIIHAVRNPYTFISSGVSQGWFLNSTIWEESRRPFMEGDWEGKPQIVKLAMFWSSVNGRILKRKKVMNVYTFRIEDVSSDVDAAQNLITRVGHLKGTREALAAKIAEKVNTREERLLVSRNVFKSPGLDWNSVPDTLRSTVDEIVAPVANLLGYHGIPDFPAVSSHIDEDDAEPTGETTQS